MLKSKLHELKAEKLEKQAERLRIETIKKRFANLQNAINPTLEPELKNQLQAAMTVYKSQTQWLEWGFQNTNTIMLFKGPPGTGKTTSAFWMAKHLEIPLLPIDMGSVGGGNAGDTERGLKEAFQNGREFNAAIFFDECESMLIDRSNLVGEGIWFLGVINLILQLIESYPHLVILSTNYPERLDFALKSRLTFEIEFTQPSIETRKKLWTAKWPAWPLKADKKEIARLAEYPLNGRTIKTCIENIARFAILQKENPSYEKIRELAARMAAENRSQD